MTDHDPWLSRNNPLLVDFLDFLTGVCVNHIKPPTAKAGRKHLQGRYELMQKYLFHTWKKSQKGRNVKGDDKITSSPIDLMAFCLHIWMTRCLVIFYYFFNLVVSGQSFYTKHLIYLCPETPDWTLNVFLM